MEQTILASAEFTLSLSSRSGSICLEVEDSHGTATARFPTKVSLVRAMADGYSYQVANEFGSLRGTLVKDEIEIRFEPPGRKGTRFQIEKGEFLNLVSHFEDNEV